MELGPQSIRMLCYVDHVVGELSLILGHSQRVGGTVAEAATVK